MSLENMQRLASFITLLAIALFCFARCSTDNQSNDLEVDSTNSKFSHLFTSQMNDYEKAVALRRAIADTLDVGFTSDSLCLNFAQIPFQEFDIEPFLQKFGNNSGAGKCGLAGSILAKTLNDHGIEAYTYNFGFEESRTTHVLVIAHTDKNQWTVHDPFFNYSLIDSLGNPKDFFTALSELALRNHSNVFYSTDSVFRDVLLGDLSSLENFVSTKCFEYWKSQYLVDNSSMGVQMPVCASCALDSTYCPELNLTYNLSWNVSKHGLPHNSFYGLLFQINSPWGPDPPILQAKIDSVFETFDKNFVKALGK